MHFLFEFLGRILFTLLLLPITWIVVSPYILIAAFFTERPYWEAVGDGYSNATDFWRDILTWI